MAVGGGGSGNAGGIRAGRAFVEIGVNDAALAAGLRRASGRLRDWGERTHKTAAQIGAGIAGVGVGIMAGVGLAIRGGLEQMREMSVMSKRLGVPIDKLSAFSYAAQTTGQSVEDLAGHWENLAERIDQAILGAGEGFEAFQRLKIDPKKLGMLDAVDQMKALADAFKNVTNENERRGLLSKLGGDKFQGLNQLFRGGSAGIQAQMDRSARLGATKTPEQQANADSVIRSVDDAWTAMKNTVFSVVDILGHFKNEVKAVSEVIISVAKGVREFMASHKQLVVVILGIVAVGTVIAGAFAAIGGIAVVLGTALAAIPAVVGLVAGAFALLLSPIGLVISGIIALGAAIALVTGVGQDKEEIEKVKQAMKPDPSKLRPQDAIIGAGLNEQLAGVKGVFGSAFAAQSLSSNDKAAEKQLKATQQGTKAQEGTNKLIKEFTDKFAFGA